MKCDCVGSLKSTEQEANDPNDCVVNWPNCLSVVESESVRVACVVVVAVVAAATAAAAVVEMRLKTS